MIVRPRGRDRDMYQYDCVHAAMRLCVIVDACEGLVVCMLACVYTCMDARVCVCVRMCV